MPSPYGTVKVVLTLDLIGGVEFTSPPMEPAQASLLLIEVGRQAAVTVLKSKKIKVYEDEEADCE